MTSSCSEWSGMSLNSVPSLMSTSMRNTLTSTLNSSSSVGRTLTFKLNSLALLSTLLLTNGTLYSMKLISSISSSLSLFQELRMTLSLRLLCLWQPLRDQRNVQRLLLTPTSSLLSMTYWGPSRRMTRWSSRSCSLTTDCYSSE
jgi:hypothetical protein